MASNEDILMQFTAQDEVSGVVAAMESSVTSSLDAITSAMDNLDAGLNNLTATSEIVSSAFSDIELSFNAAESSADNFQSTISGIDSENITGVASDVNELSDAFENATGDAESLAGTITEIDGMSVSVNIDSDTSSGDWDADAEFGGESTEQDTSALRTSMYDDLVGMSNNVRQLGNTAVESASAAEQGWLKLGNAINNSGSNWEAQESNIKSWVKTYSNSMGRGVADTRTAMTTFLNMGVSLEDTQNTMETVSNYAAQFGISQSEAAQSLQMAFMGAGRSVKKLGLDIKDFKDEAGNVDREKLLNAIMEKTSGAADKYANSYEARVQRMNNAIASLKTDFGKEIINTIEPLMPIVQQAVGAFTALPQPIKSTVLAFGGLAGGAAIVAGPLLKYKAYARMAGADTKSLVTGLKTLKTGFTTLAGGGGIRQAIDAMKKFAETQKGASVASGATGAGKGISTVANETEKTVSGASKVAGSASAANAAGAGMQSTSVGLKSIGQGAMSMLAPLLEIAIVVAVLIPVIAALAAEALIFLKGIQLLLDALDFDSIDLSSTINSIKQIGQALLEMGVAMGAMTFANITTGLAVLTSGVTGLINPVQVAGTLLIQAANELKRFNNVKIDPSIPNNLKSISQTLGLVSNAMNSLTSVVLNMAAGNLLTLGGRLGTVTGAIKTARNEITTASKEIAKLKDLEDIDEGATNKLKKISESLESVSKAMDALRSLRDGYNWDGFVTGIFGGVDIQTALESVKEDVIKASESLQNFTGVADIPDDVSNNLKKIGDSLKGVAESMDALRSLRDGYNWDGFMQGLFGGMDIPTVLSTAKTDLVAAANALSSLNGLPEIPDGVYTKVQRIGTSAKNVANVLNSIQNANFPNIVGMAMIPVKIMASRAVLYNTATQLNSLQGLPLIPDGIYTKVQRIGTSARNVGNVLTTMQGINFPNLIGMAMLPVNIASSRLVLESTSRELAQLTNLQQIPEDLAGKVMKIGVASQMVGFAVNGIQGIPFVSPEVAIKVGQAVSAVKNTATQLNSLQGMNTGAGISQALANIRNAVIQLRATLNAMRGGFRAAGTGIGVSLRAGINAGVAGLPGVISSNVSRGMNAGIGPARSGGSHVGSSGKAGFQTSFKISDVASQELTNASTALQNGSSAFLSVVHDIAAKAVEEAKNAAGVKSPGHIAHMWGDEMGYSSMMIRTKGQGVIKSISDLSSQAVGAFNVDLGSQLAFSTNALDMNRINTLRSLSQSSNKDSSHNVIINVNNGAVQLDARNLTTTESRQIMINALEGLDAITGVKFTKGA